MRWIEEKSTVKVNETPETHIMQRSFPNVVVCSRCKTRGIASSLLIFEYVRWHYLTGHWNESRCGFRCRYKFVVHKTWQWLEQIFTCAMCHISCVYSIPMNIKYNNCSSQLISMEWSIGIAMLRDIWKMVAEKESENNDMYLLHSLCLSFGRAPSSFHF